jgi:Uma2 family endonuclease
MHLPAVKAPASRSPVAPLLYPESDGQPMADNTKQARWIFVFFGGLLALFRARADVFVAADLFWYPVEGEPQIRSAPDVLVVFGRPKGDRGSYKQWEEENVPMTVVFEVLSPSNSVSEMIEKHAFYDEHGVEEYYLYDPDKNLVFAYVRGSETLVGVRKVHNFVSPRLGIRFDLSGPEMVVFHPDGRRFLTFDELEAERERERDRADKAEKRIERLGELARKVLRQEATAEEQQELERLLAPPSP